MRTDLLGIANKNRKIEDRKDGWEREMSMSGSVIGTKRLAWLGMMLGLALGGNLRAAETNIGTNQVVKHFEFKPKGAQRVGYLLFLPTGYAESEQRWPLIMFLHGA